MPHTTPIPDLLASLGTDPIAGLSPKEAAKRSEHRPASLFRPRPRRYADCVKKTIREPALWLLTAVAVVSLFFDRIALGLVCLLLTVGNTALCAYFLYRADRTDTAMLAYDTPLARVLRGGRLLRMSADGLVKGDIILLRRGDIVPADCRLLRTDGFAVLERELNAADPLRPPVRLDKNADATPETDGGLRLSPENMAFAGGLVDGGSALAVVIAVGSETHLGGLIASIPSSHRGRGAAYFKKVSGFLTVYNLGLLCLVIPLTAVGIFTVGDKYEFLDIFLSVLALASLTLTEHLLAKGIHLAAAARRVAATDRDRENTAEIKTPATLESLTAMTDLLVLGTAALHDGCPHPKTLRIGEQTFRCDRPDADEDAHAVAEFLYIYRTGVSALPSVGSEEEDYAALLTAYLTWLETDTDALKVKIWNIRPAGQAVEATIHAFACDRRVSVRLTPRFDEAEACAYIHDGVRLVPLDQDRKNTLYRAYREAALQGSISLFLLVEEDPGRLAVRAVLTYAPAIGPKTAGCIRSLEKAGIRVTACLRDVSDGNTRALAACGLTDTLPSDRPLPGGARRPMAERIAEGCRAFEGCSDEDIAACLADLKTDGRTVGVFSVDAEDVALLSEADIGFTCAPSLYTAAEPDVPTAREVLDNQLPDGVPGAATANDCSRRAAHVVVRRSSVTGGGLLGVLCALRTADGFRSALDRTTRFVLLSQLVRIVMTILPLCLGLSIAAAPALLISGLFVDLLVMTALPGLPSEIASSRRGKGESVAPRLPGSYLPEMIAAAVGAALPWVIAGIAALCEVNFGGDLIHYGLLCTVGLQLAIFRTAPLPHRDSTVFFATFGLALVYVGALAAALVAELSPLWTLCMPLVAPAAYLLTRAISLAVAGIARKI